MLSFTGCSSKLQEQYTCFSAVIQVNCLVQNKHMVQANSSDKQLVTDILVHAFDTNKSVNHMVPADNRRDQRMRALMAYSFDVCMDWGQVFLSDDKTGCALLLLPEKKKTTLRSIARDARLVISCFGLSHLQTVLRREAAIKKLQPKEPGLYLWFIGVQPHVQHRGTGSQLMQQVIQFSERIRRPLFLETSVVKNVAWYQQFGFRVYQELDLGYRLYFMRRD